MKDPTQYVGFWARVGASLIDSVALLIVLVPLLIGAFGTGYFNDMFVAALDPGMPPPSNGLADDVLQLLVAAALVIPCWIWLRATPGKIVIGAEVVDARSGGKLTLAQSVIRFLGYFVSIIPLCLGLIWVGFDPRKQGWHDKLAGTVVIRAVRRDDAGRQAVG